MLCNLTGVINHDVVISVRVGIRSSWSSEVIKINWVNQIFHNKKLKNKSVI